MLTCALAWNSHPIKWISLRFFLTCHGARKDGHWGPKDRPTSISPNSPHPFLFYFLHYPYCLDFWEKHYKKKSGKTTELLRSKASEVSTKFTEFGWSARTTHTTTYDQYMRSSMRNLRSIANLSFQLFPLVWSCLALVAIWSTCLPVMASSPEPTWTPGDFEHPNPELRRSVVIAVCFAFVLSTLAVVLRVVARKMTGSKLFLDDYLIMVALFFKYSCSSGVVAGK